MDERLNHVTVVAGNRRTLLKQLLALGIGATGAVHPGSTSAARRGHSSPDLISGGYLILVTEGDHPGEINIGITPGNGGGRAIIFANLLQSDIDVEIVQPNSGPSTYLVQSKWSLRVPIDAPGEVRWRVWRTGDTPGDFRILDFPG